jgi:hypothetical protein
MSSLQGSGSPPGVYFAGRLPQVPARGSWQPLHGGDLTESNPTVVYVVVCVIVCAGFAVAAVVVFVVVIIVVVVVSVALSIVAIFVIFFDSCPFSSSLLSHSPTKDVTRNKNSTCVY